MSVNQSKLKRNELITKINSIKQFIDEKSDGENSRQLLSYIDELEQEVYGKKYGIVFEEHKEEIDQILEKNTPVLTEDQNLFINNGGDINFLIEGDNLASLKVLQKTHRQKIDVIYIDPPYNTGNKDFIYDDNYVDKEDGYRHSKWLSFMEKRLKIARDLLKDNGVMFISIDSNEYAQLKLLCDKVLGEQSHVTTIQVESSATQGMKVRSAKKGGIVKNGEYILVYSKNGNKQIVKRKMLDVAEYDVHYSKFIQKISFNKYKVENLNKILNKDSDIQRELVALGLLKNTNSVLPANKLQAAYTKSKYLREFINDNKESIVRVHDSVEIPEETLNSFYDDEAIVFETDERSYLIGKSKGKAFQYISLKDKITYADDFYRTYGPTTIRGDWWGGFYKDMGNVSKEGGVYFNNGKKPVRLLKQLIEMTSDENSIILDFFAGSGSTGHAVLELNHENDDNRSFILCTNNENNICREKTYKRLQNIINDLGNRFSLKYQKVEFISVSERLYYEYADELLKHIRELVELENSFDFINNNENEIILTDEELETFIKDSDKNTKCKNIYLGHDVIFNSQQEIFLQQNNIKINTVPDYYYKELMGGY